ncbi:WD repeat-containing protein 87 [Gaertneriomyces sp. JEL0708]|nr:WD repeat-containing protein 87 [Gaertneriomyces sp. JEL0708]
MLRSKRPTRGSTAPAAQPQPSASAPLELLIETVPDGILTPASDDATGASAQFDRKRRRQRNSASAFFGKLRGGYRKRLTPSRPTPDAGHISGWERLRNVIADTFGIPLPDERSCLTVSDGDEEGSLPKLPKKSISSISPKDLKSNLQLDGAEIVDDAETSASSSPLTVTIPHGVIPVQHILTTPNAHHPSTCIRSILHVVGGVFGNEVFASLDGAGVSVWRGHNRVWRSTETGKKQGAIDPHAWSTLADPASLARISKWIYIDLLKVFVVAGENLMLGVLDAHFNELSRVGCAKPVLAMIWVPERKEVVTGELGSIRKWRLKHSIVDHRDVYVPMESLVISDLQEEEWVLVVLYDPTQDRILAAVDSSVYIYDYNTGERLDALRDIHEMSVTCLAYYEPSEYLITGGKDGRIKVWNSQHYLIYELQEHLNSVTALALVEPGCGATRGTVPVVISCSLDKTIRMWDFERGTCIYRLDTQQECLNLAFIKKDIFYHHSRQGIYVWNVNRHHSTFTFLRTQPTFLRRIVHPESPARILSVGQDDSIKLVSPVSGEVLSTGFPVHKDAVTLDVAYDLGNERLYSFKTNGDIAVFDTAGNPFKLVELWEQASIREKVTAICGLEIYNNNPTSAEQAALVELLPKSFFLVAGTETGGLFTMDVVNGGRLAFIIQAHSASASIVTFDYVNMCIISVGADMFVKLWHILPASDRSDATAAHPRNTWFSVECRASINISTLGVPKTIAVDMAGQAVGVSCGGSLVILGYQTEMAAKPRAKESEQAAGVITCISHNASLGLWLSAHVDGLLKIWDNKSFLIREIQFNEPLLAACFLNGRGDLLVGLSDQISLIKMQDYLPPHILIGTLARNFPDDILEHPLHFNARSDFWEYVYEREKWEKGDEFRWHMKRDEPRIEDPIVIKPAFIKETQSAESQRLEAIKRRNRRIFLAQEYKAFSKAHRFETVAPQRTISAKPAKAAWMSETEATSSDELADENANPPEGEDLVLVRHYPSEPDLVEILGITSPTEGMAQPLPINIDYLLQRAPGRKRRPISSDAEAALQRRRESLAALVRNPNRPGTTPLDKAAIEARRASLRQKLQHAGVVMPNSTLRNEIQQQPQRKQSVFQRRGSVKPAEQHQPRTTSKYVVPVNRARAQRKRSEAKEDKWHRRESTISNIVQEQDEELAMELEMAGIQEEEEKLDEEIPPAISPPVFEAEEEAIVLVKKRKTKGKKVAKRQTQPQEAPVRLSSTIAALSRPPARIRREPPKSAPVSKSESKAVPRPKSLLPPKPLAETVRPQPVLPTVMTLPQERPIVVAQPIDEKIPVDAPHPVRKVKKKVKVVPRTSEVEPWFKKYEEEVIEEKEIEELDVNPDVPLPTINIADAKREAATFAWNLIRFRDFSKEEMPPGLKRLMGLFWFPQLKGGQVTLTAIVEALVHLLEVGLWLEKVEASKALLFLYHTFKEDFLDPMVVLIQPQLAILDDENWQVRAQLCSNVAQYDIAHLDIISGLIYRLVDVNDHVRQVSMEALSHLGVHTKEDLKIAMRKMGVLPKLAGTETPGLLDMLIMQKQKQNQLGNSGQTHAVVRWLEKASRTQWASSGLRRDSYYEHLAGPYFPPDANTRNHSNEDGFEFRGRTRNDSGGYDTGRGTSEGWEDSRARGDRSISSVYPSPPAERTLAKSAEPHGHGKRQAPLRSALASMRPLTAGAVYAHGGAKGLTGIVSRKVSRPATPMVHANVLPDAEIAKLNQLAVEMDLTKPWSVQLRRPSTMPDPEMHDRPFRA